MGTSWRNVDNKCIHCQESVGKFSIKNGKIVVEQYKENWGCWQKVPNKSEMQVMCCYCQKKVTKEKFKASKREAKSAEI